MMILLVIVVVLLLVLTGILVYAATKPDQYAVERSIIINTIPEHIFPLINDLHAMNRWNPFLGKDAAIQGDYNEIAAGEGAGYSFTGDKQSGSGHISITRSKVPVQVDMSLLLLRPFPGANEISFYLKPHAGSTQVVWNMRGKSPYIMKVISVFFKMDTVVGRAFEQGLLDLKKQAEAKALDNAASGPE